MRLNKLFTIIVFVVFTFIIPSCKKNPTVPNSEILSRPVIWINGFEFSFAAAITGDNPSAQILKIKNSGKETLSYSISSDAEWLSVTTDSGASAGQINEHTISVDKSGLPAQVEPHKATLTVTSNEAYNNPQKITVSLMLTEEPPPTFDVSPKNLTFTGLVGGANPASQEIFIQNTGGNKLVYTIATDKPWLSVNPKTGESKTNKKTIKVLVDTSGISKGNYKGQIQISDPNATNSPQTVNVTLDMTETAPPQIGVRPNKLSFQSFVGGANPAAQSLYISNTGEGTLRYTLAGDANWLSVSPNSGSTTGVERRHTVSVIAGGLSAGTYNGTILVEDSNAANSPVAVGVTLTISAPLTDNKVGISISPVSGGTDTIVQVSITVRGNLTPIEAFGLQINFNSTMFQYAGISNGSLTGNWAVGGNVISPGVITVGGYAGAGTAVPIGSLGTLAVVNLRVTCGTCSDNLTSQITISGLSDDISGMIMSPASATFTFDK